MLLNFSNFIILMVTNSVDIEYLYPNITINETVGIIFNKLLTSSSLLRLSRSPLQNLFQKGQWTLFSYSDNLLCKQCDGLGMGLPQSPSFSNIFFAHCYCCCRCFVVVVVVVVLLLFLFLLLLFLLFLFLLLWWRWWWFCCC